MGRVTRFPEAIPASTCGSGIIIGILCVPADSPNRVPFFVTLQTEARQAPLSMEFSRQEYWHGLPFPSAGDLPDPGIKPGSPALQTDSLQSEPPRTPPHTHSVYKILEVMNKNFPKIMTENKRQAQGS